MHLSQHTTCLFCFIATVALVCLPHSTVQAQVPRSSESLTYSVALGYSSKVASLVVKNQCSTLSKVQKAALFAKSDGLVNALHSFSLRFDSFYHPSSYQPRQGHTTITEEGRTRHYVTSFRGEKSLVKANIFGTKKPQQTHKLPTRAHDMLSWLIDLRWNTPTKVGGQRQFWVWDGWKLVRFTAKVGKHTTLQTALGEQTAWPVHLTRQRTIKGTTLLARGTTSKLGTIWFTTSRSRLPVLMNLKAPVGHVEVKLVRYDKKACEGGKGS